MRGDRGAIWWPVSQSGTLTAAVVLLELAKLESLLSAHETIEVGNVFPLEKDSSEAGLRLRWSGRCELPLVGKHLERVETRKPDSCYSLAGIWSP